MNDFLKTYILTFKTKAPVFIGSGRTISKKEYIYDRREGRVFFMDVDRMYHGLLKMHLGEKYENYLLNDRNTDLFGFLRENNITRQQYQNWIRYSEPVGDPAMDSHSIKDLNEFVKGPDGMPYIPGTSIKGAFRTMLESSAILRNHKKFIPMQNQIAAAQYKDRPHYLQREQEALTREIFHRELFHDKNGNYDPDNMVNDIMRGMSFGDSSPLSYENLCLCQKIDMTTTGEYKNLNVLRECIKPETTIELQISIDQNMCPYSNIDILKAVADFYKNYIDEFMSKFSGSPAILGNSTTFFLGGGAGYASKTVTHAVMKGSPNAVGTVANVINKTLPIKICQKHGHENDVRKRVSPHMLKCTKYGNKRYQMGACCILQLH